jgi:hypothetical protein
VRYPPRMPGKKTGRTNKPGAGRPKELPEPTAPVRVPRSIASWVRNRENWDKLKKWIDNDSQ